LIGIGGARDVPFNIVTNLDGPYLQQFIDIDGASPALNFRIAASNHALAQGEYDGVLSERHYDAAIPLLDSDRYVQWCDEVDIPFGCQTNLVVDRVGLVGLATLRRRKEGRTTARQRKTFTEAAVAARRAVRLQERIEGNQAKLLAGAFAAIDATAFVLDARGRVQAMTETAEHLVSCGDVAMRDHQLDAPGAPLSLAHAVAVLVADETMPHVRLKVDSRGGKQPHFIEGFRLPQQQWSLGHLPHAILLVRAPQRDRAGISGFLTALYRLSAAEADIAIRLFEGKSRAEICETRKVTPETLRGQIKTIHAKTGSAKEADLMRLLAAIMT
jgi:DNA-binding CsgD family transcriptional regulator